MNELTTVKQPEIARNGKAVFSSDGKKVEQGHVLALFPACAHFHSFAITEDKGRDIRMEATMDGEVWRYAPRDGGIFQANGARLLANEKEPSLYSGTIEFSQGYGK